MLKLKIIDNQTIKIMYISKKNIDKILFNIKKVINN